MRVWMCFPLLTGCFGVYAEVAATTYPSASLGSASTSASSVSFNVGADFGNTSKRFALGYESQSISVDKGGSASLGASSARLDFNVLSVSDRAKVRLGGAFDIGSGSSKAAGMTKSDATGGGAYAGVGFTYFPTWHVGLHALAGAAYGGATLPSGNLSGTGATFRLAVTYQFSDVRPTTTKFYPLEHNTDITGALDNGARAMGCVTMQESHAAEGYAFVNVTCSGKQLEFFQVQHGMLLRCDHMFEAECEGLGNQIIASATQQQDKARDAATMAKVDEALAKGGQALGVLKCTDDRDVSACEQACTVQRVPAACDVEAQLYMQGKGVTIDEARAEALYAQSCDGGYGAGCYHLGSWQVMKATRQTGEQTMAPAITAMTRACDVGYGDGCTAMGTAHLLGQGVPKDEGAAVKFFERGCDASSASSCYSLAQVYGFGLPSIAKDSERAMTLMKKACDLKNHDACRALQEGPPDSQKPAQSEGKPGESLPPPR